MEPLDIQASDHFCRLAGAPSPTNAAAVLLDAERSGCDLRNLAISAVEAVRRQQGQSADDSELLLDVVDMTGAWRLEGFHPREGLVEVFGTAMSTNPEDEDVIGWIDSFVSLHREGYDLSWLAKRLSNAAGTQWSTVLKVADAIITERNKDFYR